MGEDYVEDPSSFDSMCEILDAIVTRAHSSCANKSASSASLAAWAADGFRRDGGAFRRETFSAELWEFQPAAAGLSSSS